MSEEAAGQVSELRLASESIEALATRLAELLVVAPPPERRSALPRRLLTAAEVSEWWGVARRWVYNHADQLGARRLGSGRRPRLRFDPDEVAERLGAPAPRPPGGRDGRRLTAMGGNPHSDSLSSRGRAIVAARGKDGRGGGATPPGPAPKEVLRHTREPSPTGLSRPITSTAAERSGGDR